MKKEPEHEPQQFAGEVDSITLVDCISSTSEYDAELDKLVRDIFEITSSHYWDDRAAEITGLIKAYCRKDLSTKPEQE